MIEAAVLAGISILWALGFYFIRVGVTYFSLFLFSSYRLIAAFLMFFTHLAITGLYNKSVIDSLGEVSKSIKKFGFHFVVMGILNFTVPFILSSYAQHCVTLGLSSIVETSIPLFTQFFAHFLTNDERITIPISVGLLLGFLGVTVAVLPHLSGSLSTCSRYDTTMSILALLGAAAGYGYCNVYFKQHLRKLSHVVNGCGQMMVACAVSCIITIVSETPRSIVLQLRHAPLKAHASAILLGVAAIYVAYLGQFYLIEKKGSVYAGLTGFLMPITAVFLGVVMEDEWKILPAIAIVEQLLGLAVTLTGIAVIVVAQKKRDAKLIQ